MNARQSLLRSRRVCGAAGLGAALTLGLIGCTVPELPKPRPGQLEVIVPPEVPVTQPRAALVWVAPGPIASVQADVAVEEGRALLPLSAPPEDFLEIFRPVESAEFITDEGVHFASAEVMRPRLVYYEDANGDGRLDLPPPLGSGEDRLLALDRGSKDGVAWILDLELLFSQALLVHNDTLFDLLGQDYSPWVRVTGAGQLFAYEAQRGYDLQVGEPELLQALLYCPRYEVSGANLKDVRTLVDPLAPARFKCDPGCRDPAFRLVPAQATSVTPQLPVREECQRGAQLWAWRQRQEGVLCEGCQCEFIEYDVIAVTAAADPPEWWPCEGAPGGQVPPCEGCALLCELGECDGTAGELRDAGPPDAPALDAGVGSDAGEDATMSDAGVREDAAGSDAGAGDAGEDATGSDAGLGEDAAI